MTKADRTRAWLQLLRAPNLLTVPGDPLAGFLVAGQGGGSVARALMAAAASVLLYAAGLLLNDLADLEVDRRERPDRPLPRGTVRKIDASVATVVLFAAGGWLCVALGPVSRLVGFALILAILLYNIGLKSHALAGPIGMGACRALSLLLGATAAPLEHPFTGAALLAAGIVLWYVAALTRLARGEMEGREAGLDRWGPAIALTLGFAFFAGIPPISSLPEWIGFTAAFFFAGVIALVVADLLENLQEGERVQHTPRLIGYLIGGLLLLQAAFAMGSGAGRTGLLVGLVLLALWPVNRAVAQRISPS